MTFPAVPKGILEYRLAHTVLKGKPIAPLPVAGSFCMPRVCLAWVQSCGLPAPGCEAGETGVSVTLLHFLGPQGWILPLGKGVGGLQRQKCNWQRARWSLLLLLQPHPPPLAASIPALRLKPIQHVLHWGSKAVLATALDCWAKIMLVGLQ